MEKKQNDHGCLFLYIVQLGGDSTFFSLNRSYFLNHLKSICVLLFICSHIKVNLPFPPGNCSCRTNYREAELLLPRLMVVRRCDGLFLLNSSRTLIGVKPKVNG